MQNTENDVLKKIKSCIGNKVSFKYPGDEGEKNGKLKDRVVIKSDSEGEIPYWDVVDLIDFEGQKEPWMRIGYYRKPKDKLNWGSQTTITEPISVWKKILVNSAKEMPWFRTLLNDVMKEI
jgi:hypothetical protein